MILSVTIQRKLDCQSKKKKKWKNAGLLIGVDREGNIKRIEVIPAETPSDKTDKINKAMEKAVQKVSKFKNAPVIKKPEFKFKIRMKGTDLLLFQD